MFSQETVKAIRTDKAVVNVDSDSEQALLADEKIITVEVPQYDVYSGEQTDPKRSQFSAKLLKIEKVKLQKKLEAINILLTKAGE